MGNPARPAGLRPAVHNQILRHEQLRSVLLRMAKEELGPGGRLPSERTLMEQFQVSRITVRAAVGRLVGEGRLARVQGKATFLAERTARPVLQVISVTKQLDSQRLKPGMVVLAAALRPPPLAIACVLGLGPSQAAHHVRRLRTAARRPAGVEDAWYNPSLVPGLLDFDLTGSIHALLADAGRRVDRARQNVRAGGALSDVAALLGTEPGAPVLSCDRVSYSGPETIEYVRS